MTKSENLVTNNSANATKIQTSGFNWTKSAKQPSCLLGHAFTINKMVSIPFDPKERNTHIVGTGEAADRIKSWRDQLGGVDTRSAKSQIDQPTTAAQSIFKYVCGTAGSIMMCRRPTNSVHRMILRLYQSSNNHVIPLIRNS